MAAQMQDFKIRRTAARRLQDDPDYWRRDENLHRLPARQREYALLEWHRRIYGIWIWIGGRLTWLSGFHYFYIQHWRIDAGWPSYRDRDRRFFYAWQVCYDDARCEGMVYLKHRRDGATYRFSCIGYEIISRGDMDEKHFGITSKGDNEALEVLNDKVGNPFDHLVPFFKPRLKAKLTKTKEQMVFGDPAESSVDAYAEKMTPEAWVKRAAKGKQGLARWDGSKLCFALNDEGGKRVDENIDELDRLTGESLKMAGREGKSAWPTTNEEMVGDNAERFENMFRQSGYELRAASRIKTTPSRKYRYFTPCYDGLDEHWFGPFGESIVGPPTKEQIDHVRKNEISWMKIGDLLEQGIGGHEYWSILASEARDKTKYLHMYPGTPEDAFAKVNASSDFNPKVVNDTLRGLGEIMADGRTREQHLTIRGRLESVDNDIKKPAYFVEDPKGPFLVNREYLPVYVGSDGRPVIGKGPTWGGQQALDLRIFTDRVMRSPARQGHGESCGRITIDEAAASRVVIGFDPQKLGTEPDGRKVMRRSSAAMHGFIPHLSSVDGPRTSQMKRDNPDFGREWKSHAWVFEYENHPRSPYDTFEDAIRAAMFWSGKIAYERVVSDFGNWCQKKGLLDLLETNMAEARRKPGKHIDKGFHTDRDMIDQYHKLLTDWVEYHCCPETCPFTKTLKQWLAFTPGNTEKFDLAVSSGMAMLGWTRGDPDVVHEIAILQPPEPKEKARSIWEDFDYVNVG